MSRFIFPPLPDLWRKARISDIAALTYGKALHSKRRVKQGEVGVYGSSGLVGRHDESLGDGPSIIIGRKGNIGAVHYVSEPFWCIDTAFYLTDIREVVDLEYLAFALEQIHLPRLAINVAVPGIARDDILRERIPLPPLSEQRHIVKILKEADAIRDFRRQADEQNQSVLPALYESMFGKRTSSAQAVPEVPLGKAGTLDRGKSKHRPRDASHLYGGPYPFIQTGDVAASNGWITESHQSYSEEGLAQSKLWPAGTLCITIAANIAKTGILTFDACFPDSVVGFVPGKDFTVEYVRQWFESIQAQLDRFAPKGAQKNINLKILRALKIPKQSLPEQEQFVAAATALRDIVDDGSKSCSLCESLEMNLSGRGFQGLLTEQWREQHLETLREEAAERDALLAEAGVSVAAPQKRERSPNLSPFEGREAALAALSVEQMNLLAVLGTLEGPNTFQEIDVHEEASAWSPKFIQQSLQLFTQMGLLICVTRKDQQAERGRQRTHYYRLPLDSDDGEATFNDLDGSDEEEAP